MMLGSIRMHRPVVVINGGHDRQAPVKQALFLGAVEGHADLGQLHDRVEVAPVRKVVPHGSQTRNVNLRRRADR